MDTIVNVLGILYGFTLILAAFVRNRVLEAMRVDAMVMEPSESTRLLNLVVGLLVVGYAIYSLMAG